MFYICLTKIMEIMTTQAASKLSKQEVYNLLKVKGHTDWSANEIAVAHENGKDYSFLF